MEKADIEIGESTVSHDLANFIIEHSEAARSLDESDWEKLDGTAWVHVLRSHPELADKCDWSKIKGYGWAGLLSERPEFADKCDSWDAIDGHAICYLLSIQPQFAGKFDLSGQLGHALWAKLLGNRPEFADRCPWETLDTNDWARLVSRQPRFAETCDFAAFRPKHWAVVLRKQPQLADKCDWTALPLRMVAALLAEQPLAAEVAKKQRGFRGRYLSISFDGTSEATSFACMPDLAMKDPQSENRRVSIYKKDGQPNPWPDPVEFKPPKLVPYANLEPGYNTVLKVEEDGELLLKRRLAVAYLVGVKLLPPEFVFAGRDDQFFKEHAIEGADIEGFWVDYVQHHGRVKWTRWVLELPEGEHFDPGKLEIPVFTGYTVEEPDPDLDAEFFCDPKRIRYDGKHPDAESMQFRSDPKFDEDVLTGVEL